MELDLRFLKERQRGRKFKVSLGLNFGFKKI